MNARLILWLGTAFLFVAGWSLGRRIGFSGLPKPLSEGFADPLILVEAAPAPAGSDLLARIQSAAAADLKSFYKGFTGGAHEDLDSLLAFRALVRRSVREDPGSILKGAFTGNQIEEIAVVWLEVDPAGFFAHLPLAEK